MEAQEIEESNWTAKMFLLPSTYPPNITDVILTHPAPEVIRLRGQHADIGRATTRTICIHSLQISRKHCTLDYKDSKWWIQDFSTNGVLVNELPIGKNTLKELHNKDTINVIPGGYLSYRFEYEDCKVAVSSAAVEEHVQSASVPLQLPVDTEDGNASDESESILSLANGEGDPFESAISTGFGSILNESDVEILEALDNSAFLSGGKPKPANLKRSADVLSPPNKTLRKIGTGASRFSFNEEYNDAKFFTTEHDENEELLDLDDADALIVSPQRKIPRTEDECNIAVSSNSPVSIPSLPTSSVSPVEQQKLPEVLDQQVLNTQLKYFTDQCKDLKSKNSLLVLSHTMERNQLNEELEKVKTSAASEKSQLYQNLISVLDSELNCCVCNEVFIHATVIDCGHTFCYHCIMEWMLKKKDCPICRTVITKTSKQIELNNFLLKIHSMLPLEAQLRREALLKDRESEVSVAQAVQAAELQERTSAAAAGGVAGGGSGNFLRNRAFTSVGLEPLRLEDLGDFLGMGNWNQVFREIGGTAVDAPSRSVPVAVSRRSSRIRSAVVNPAGSSLDSVLQSVASRRGARRRRGANRAPGPVPTPAAASPDLITLDDSQDLRGVRVNP